MGKLLLLMLLVTTIQMCSCGNILFWMGVASTSHYIVWKPLALELAKRGHNLTVVVPLPFPELQAMPNVKYILAGVNGATTINSTESFEGVNSGFDIETLTTIIIQAQDVLINNVDIQELIKEKPQFDVSFFDPFSLDLGLYMAKTHFNSPVILFLTCLRQPHIDLAMGNPVHPAYIPVELIGYSQRMTFKERVFNTIATMLFLYTVEMYINPRMEDKLQEILGLEKRPDISAMTNDADFAFINAHPVFENVVSTNPNTALIGGLHLRPAKPLPADLKKCLDEAKEGVILVSYGSVLKGSSMPESQRKLLVQTLGKLKQQVLWKWETETMADLPDNVLLKKWLPQQDILGHPNVKLFITHGGLLSIEEALYHNVPMVVMPGFADQVANAARAVRLGYGKELLWKDLDENNLLEIVQSLLVDKKAQESVEYYGAILRDNMMPALDVAVYHTEYIMRHKGAKHLKSPANELYWFQYMLLDVMAFLLISIFITVFILFKVLQLALRLFLSLCGGKKAAKAKKNN